MRNISFALTTPQFIARTKTVTRRNGWWFMKPGDRVQAVEKAMGLKKGEKVVKLGVIEIVSVRREPLLNIMDEPNGCGLEGFPEWNDDPQQFIDMYCDANGSDARDDVNRIEFRYVDEVK
jgi:hypothetical protein